MPLTARILSQGDEITTGATTDTNAGWIARELSARGVRVLGMAAAPDDLEALVSLFQAAGRDADLVVSTGGLGPTDDDLSALAAARASGVELIESKTALGQIEARFLAIQREMSPSNRKQAWLPDGAELLENTAGSAPGFAHTIGRARFFFFPGVPRELFIMAPRHLFPWLQTHGLEPARRARLHVCGIGESALQDRLRGLELPSGVRLGYKTWQPYNSIILYADANDAHNSDSAARLERARALVIERIRDEVFGEDDTTLAMALGRSLLARGETLALAESCTAGLASAMVTEAPGSSAWFTGTIISYNNAVKQQLLEVPGEVLRREGAVSEASARAMAEGARRALGTSWGIAITGIAGPDGGSVEKPVGLVWFALASAAGTDARSILFGDRGRDQVRIMAAASAIEWLRRRIQALGPGTQNGTTAVS